MKLRKSIFVILFTTIIISMGAAAPSEKSMKAIEGKNGVLQ